MSGDSQSTISGEFDNETSRQGGARARPFRFILPRTRDLDSTEDALALLRQRLIIVSIVFTCAPAIYAARALYFLSQGERLPGAGWPDLIFLAAAFALTLGLLITLLCNKSPSLRCLRIVELLGFGHAMALFTWWLFDQLQAGWLVGSGDEVSASTVIMARFWVLPFYGLIMAYGTLIPNTWRRCTAVVCCIASCPILVVVSVMLIGTPYANSTLLMLVLEMMFWLSVAAGIAIFGVHRMEVLRRRVVEARTLGQYQLHDLLGGGGMGEVYLAEHVLLRRPCAIKLIRPDRAGDPEHLLRFMREVQATATLSHPNTIQVFDYGHTDDGTFYYVMEYLPGVTLAELVDVHGPLPAARAIHFLRQICEALQEAHSIGLIHRDIKPGNVIVCRRGGRHDRAKLLDFGLVLPLRKTVDEMIPDDVHAVVGTPAFMSPEQAGGQDQLDVRSDIYSVGALAYFILTGKSPFRHRSVSRMLAAHRSKVPKPLSQHRPELPEELNSIVMRCLAKSPSDRFPNASSLASALASCREADDWSDEKAADWWRGQQEIGHEFHGGTVSDEVMATTASLGSTA